MDFRSSYRDSLFQIQEDFTNPDLLANVPTDFSPTMLDIMVMSV